MTDQTAIPVPQGPAELGPCAWCGGKAVGLVEVEKPIWGKQRKGSNVRTLKKAAIEAPACRAHISILDTQPAPDEAAA